MTRVPHLSMGPVGASDLTVRAEGGGSSRGAPAHSGAAQVLKPGAPASQPESFLTSTCAAQPPPFWSIWSGVGLENWPF